MKPQAILLALITFGLTGCATTVAPPSTISRAATDAIGIHSAFFGNGLNVADVKNEVVKLLRTGSEGFVANAKSLNADPLPYHEKCLVIDYELNGGRYLFFVTNGKRVNYDILIRNAEKMSRTKH
jgi:hypothetical protein